MLFNSYEFLFLFLPLVLGGYALLRRGGRTAFLTLASYVFYGWWDYRFCSLMVISTVVDYVAGLSIERAPDRKHARRWLWVSMVSNLSLLGFFKYADLGAGTFNHLAGMAGIGDGSLLPMLQLTLPIGISFYTFQSMSYSIDIYLGAAKPVRNFWSFACYVALFPQLIAGPIVRYRELAEQLVHRTHTVSKCALGACFFLVGLSKKVLIADGVAALADAVFNEPGAGLAVSWLGAVSYAVQIYFDFSGYSDMAVGLGLLFGFQLPQNFNSPYKADSITDFWRRWHMSLSRWLRDYLYIPLGGNRRGVRRTFINLFLTMLLGGLWHGANWTFVVWGGYHGVLLAVERVIGKRSLFFWAPRGVRQGGTFLLVLIGWVVFRSPTLADAGQVLWGMTGGHGWGESPVAWLADRSLHGLVLGFGVLLMWGTPNSWEIRWRFTLWTALLGCALLVLCVMVILVNASSPFLYFQF